MKKPPRILKNLNHIGRKNRNPAGNPAVLQTTGPTNKAEVADVAKVLTSARDAAKNVLSLFLSQHQKVESVETFVLDVIKDLFIGRRETTGALVAIP